MLRRGSLLALTFLVSTLTVAVAEDRGEWTVVQPSEAPRSLLLWSRPGEARVEVEGKARSYDLADGELLTDIVKTRDGWVAAGRRRDEDGSSRLVVVTADNLGFRRLDRPASEDRVQVRPQLLVRDGRFDGITWLAGGSTGELSVRSRAWTGADWGPLETVSGPGPGSQTGLSVATLKDGESLLVWSAFDGNDDEIRYSLSNGNGWDAPRRLGPGNRVPDVTPTVIATRGGALAAWSRFDGSGYELMIARFRRGRWQPPRSLGAGLFPSFHRMDGRLYLLHRTAEPRGWGVLEIDAGGDERRRSGFLATAPTRPSIALRDGSGIDLHWPERAAARGYWNVP